MIYLSISKHFSTNPLSLKIAGVHSNSYTLDQNYLAHIIINAWGGNQGVTISSTATVGPTSFLVRETLTSF